MRRGLAIVNTSSYPKVHDFVSQPQLGDTYAGRAVGEEKSVRRVVGVSQIAALELIDHTTAAEWGDGQGESGPSSDVSSLF